MSESDFWLSEQGILLRTEDLAHSFTFKTYNRALKGAFEESGVEELMWITDYSGGNEPCNYCDSQNERRYNIGQFLPRIPAHIHCISSTVGVETNEGLKFASQIRLGDNLLTGMGRLNSVKQIMKHKYDGDFANTYLRWNGKRNYILKGLTTNHLVKTDSGFKPVGILDRGDKLYGMAKRCPYCKELIPVDKVYCDNSCKCKYEAEVLGIDKWKIGRQRIIEKYGSFSEMIRQNNVTFKVLSKMPKKDTHIEKVVESWLKRMRLKYKKQFPVKVGKIKVDQKIFRDEMGRLSKEGKLEIIRRVQDRYRFIDFYVPDEKWFVEADGKVWHNEERDRKRDIEILLEYPDHKITHIEFGSTIKHETFTLTDLITNNGHVKFVPMEVEETEIYQRKKWRKVWNFNVEPDQTYVIGKPRIIVHNCKCFWDMYIRL